MPESLPKSLHTVRILLAVALADVRDNPVTVNGAARAVYKAAVVIGYPNAAADDPLIAKACAQLLKLRGGRANAIAA